MNSENTVYPYDLRKIFNDKGKVFFVGMGGSMMTGIAKLLSSTGFCVIGSDRLKSAVETLSNMGLFCFPEHKSENITPDVSLLVYSSAVDEDNPERKRAKELGIPTLSRAEFLGVYMTNYAYRVGVCGTHGKSTTTALLDFVATGTGQNPTTLVGAVLPEIETPQRVGEKDLFLYESCEYRDSFLHFFPSYGVFLNMEWDHTDYFKTEEQMRQSFLHAMNLSERAVIANADDREVSALCRMASVPVFTFGKDESADLRIENLKVEKGHCSFDATLRGFSLGRVECGELSSMGYVHAGAALSLASLLGWDLSLVKERIASFPGIPRRLELLKKTAKQTVYYDYAHHPSEIASVLTTLKELSKSPVTAVFRPHTYSRTKDLFSDFVRALGIADAVVVTDVFPARETPVVGINGEALAKAVGSKAKYVPLSQLKDEVLPLSDTVVLLGAGDFETLPEIIKKST